MRSRRLTRILAVGMMCAVAGAVPVLAAGGHFSRNLLLNPGAGAGAISVQGWDSVTIPGWHVLVGLPTVVRYGTAGFPRGAGFARGGELFAGGPGGTALLAQRVALRLPPGRPLAPGTRFRLSAWLGGTTTSAASVTVTFLSATGTPVQDVTIGPVGDARKPTLARRSRSGAILRRAASAEVVVHLSTSLKNYDGPNAPIVGYNRAVAGELSFTVSAPVRMRSALQPPPARVPPFDHVFLFTFENQGLRAVIGNRRQAPYLNSLLAKGSLLSNLFAEEHPSDGNYLALAAGGVFGVPLTNPLESNPRFTINVPHIGDLVGTAHKTWRAYLQSAAGPCDDTVHGYYWDDDLPFLYFPDVRDRPAFCSAHVVPLEAMSSDLASAATTPSFSWIGPDDCGDMEGCGIRTGDRFLAQTLANILRSPAWTTQRSLAIITFDEDAYNHEHPPQLVPTIVLGSAGVRAGYVSRVRYTHYSLLRTIEVALGLGTLTKNDRYAQPFNDVFGRSMPSQLSNSRRAVRFASAGSQARPGGRSSGASRSASGARRAHDARRSATAFVANFGSASVTPVSLATGKAGPAIRVGSGPDGIAVTPDGRTAYVVNGGSGTVTPIDTLTKKPAKPIRVGSDPRAIALAPDGRTAYVVNSGSDNVTPIDTLTSQPGTPIPVGAYPRAIAVNPNGKSAYVLNWGGASVTPIDLATNTPKRPIPVGSYPSAIAFAPGGGAAYVTNYGSNTVTEVNTSDDQPGPSIAVGQAPNALAVTPDGATVEVVSGDTESVTPISTSTLQARRSIRVGFSPGALAVSPDGATAWVVNTISSTVTPIAVRSDHGGRPISVGVYTYPTAIAFAPGGVTAVIVDSYGGQVTLLNTRTRRAGHPITVGSYPAAVAIAG